MDPPGSDFVVIDTGPPTGLMVTLKLSEADCVGLLESFAFTVKLKVPAKVGVPTMIPDGSRVRPVGKLPEIMLNVTGGVPPAV